MTSHLILNLRAIRSQPYSTDTHEGYDGAQSAWEANIIGNLGNAFDNDSSKYSSSTDNRISWNWKGRRRRTMADEIPVGQHLPVNSYELVEQLRTAKEPEEDE